jgi:hypothetical protein
VLEQHHRVVLGTQQYSGFVLKIDGTGTSRPDNTHYWSYWHSGGGGTWTYSNAGAGSTHPRAGTVEGWSYVNGQSRAPKPPRYTYAALCGHLDPKPQAAPKATPTSAAASARPTPATSTSSKPAVVQPPPAQPTPSRSASTKRTFAKIAPPPPPTARATAHPTGSATSAHRTRAISTHTKSAATPPATKRRPAPVHASAARTLAAEPTAADKTDSGFPAWGTVVAVLVIAGLGGTAWTLARRRAN